MKKVGFIGAFDKTNLITYIAKIIEQTEKSVLVIDASLMQKTKYVVPSINPTKSYITDFENIDFAIGFESMEEIIRYFGVKKDDELPYDYIILDIDDAEKIVKFGIEDTKENYFVTGFDMYSLQKGIEILKNMPTTLNLTKVLCNYELLQKEDEEYIDFLAADTKVVWNDVVMYIPQIDQNEKLIEENQRVYKLRLKKLNIDYQECVIYLTQNILKDVSINKIKKMIKE